MDSGSVTIPSVAWIRGRCVPFAEACVPLEDRGLQFGESLYEVIAVTAGRVRYLSEHAARLRSGAEMLGIAAGAPSDAEWQRVVDELTQRDRLDEGLLIAQLTGGTAPRAHLPKTTPAPTFFAYLRPYRFPRDAEVRAGIAAITHPDVRWARSDLKTTMLLGSVLAKRAAAARAASEAILVGGDGLVHEGASSNVFLAEGRQLFTPPQSSHLLAGTTRPIVVRLAHMHGVAVADGPIDGHRLLGADEVFVTSTTFGVMPVVRIDDQPIGTGHPGPIAVALAASLAAELCLE